LIDIGFGYKNIAVNFKKDAKMSAVDHVNEDHQRSSSLTIHFTHAWYWHIWQQQTWVILKTIRLVLFSKWQLFLISREQWRANSSWQVIKFDAVNIKRVWSVWYGIIRPALSRAYFNYLTSLNIFTTHFDTVHSGPKSNSLGKIRHLWNNSIFFAKFTVFT